MDKKEIFLENTPLDTSLGLKLIDCISALATWTGRQADALGFTDTIEVSHLQSVNAGVPHHTVYSTFEKSNPLASTSS